MAEPKTKVSDASVEDFLNLIEPESKKADGFKLLKIFEEVTGEKAKIWGTSMVGFGSYHYKSERSSQEGDWFVVGFSPRKAALAIYLMMGMIDRPTDLFAKLGKYKASAGCVYVDKLTDIDEKVLRELIANSVKKVKKKYPS